MVDDASEDETLRKDAYLSIARAMGAEWEALPPLSRLPPLENLVDVGVMKAARERLASDARC